MEKLTFQVLLLFLEFMVPLVTAVSGAVNPLSTLYPHSGISSLPM